MNEFSLLELINKANIFGWEREFVRVPEHAAPAEVLPQEPGHLDYNLMAHKPSPKSQQLSEFAHCRQLTKHDLPMAFLSELGYHRGSVQIRASKTQSLPQDLDF